MTFFSRIMFSILVLASTAVAAAADEGPTGTSQQPIVAGDEVSVERQHDLGLVTVGGGCSGTLLNQYWVLTADHCVGIAGADGNAHPGEPDAPFNGTAITATWSSQTVIPTGYVRYWRRNGLDVALIFLGKGDFGPS